MSGRRVASSVMWIAISCGALSQGHSSVVSTSLVQSSNVSVLTPSQGRVVQEDELHAKVLHVVAQIKRADFEDDRASLKELYSQLEPFTRDERLASFAYYWRGFALWRRSLNGFNDAIDKYELGVDLENAAHEFATAREHTPTFVEAAIGEAGCEGTLIFLYQSKPEQMNKHIVRWMELMKIAREDSSDNPRFLWVLGGSLWGRPATTGGSQIAGMETYHRGLISAEEPEGSFSDPLQPSWGRAELLMSIAWASLHQSTPDLNAAAEYARAALQLEPNWHYVRDILLPQILQAQAKRSK